MSLKAGQLRHRIRIEENNPTQDTTTGAMTNVWSTVEGCEAVPCQIRAMSVRELLAAQAVQSKTNTRIVIRRRGSKKILPTMRAYDESENVYYNIEGVMDDPESGREYLTLVCSTGVLVA